MRHARGVVFAVLSLLFPVLARAAGQDATSRAIEAKVALESSLEKRVALVLNQVLGTDKLVVIINVELLSQQEEDKKLEILPGVPLKETPASSALAATLTMVKRIACTVMLDASTSDKDVELARKVAGGLLGLNTERGDSLMIDKMTFYHEAPFSWRNLMRPPQLFYLLWTALALIALLATVSGFFRPLMNLGREMSAALKAQAESAARSVEIPAAAGAGAATSAEGGAAATNGHAEHARDGVPFGFIQERHLPRLAYLLKRESPETAAVVVSYLPAEMGAHLLDGLDSRLRAQTVAKLATVEELGQAKVQAIESSIQSKIEYLVGGEDRVRQILDLASPTAQRSMVDEIKRKHRALGDKLDRDLPRLEDLAALEAGELQSLLKRAPMSSVAQSLKQVPDAAENLLARLPEGLAARLREELELARPISKDRLEEEERRVLTALRQLAREGWIRLHKENGGGEPGGAA